MHVCSYLFATARQHAVLNFEQATDLKPDKPEKILEALGKLVDADFFMVFKNSASMSIDAEGERIQQEVHKYTAKLTAMTDVLKSHNAKPVQDDGKTDSTSSRLAAYRER